MKTATKLWIGLGVLTLLSPLGILLPEYFKAQDAWGECGADVIKKLVGYVPVGVEKLSSLWNAPLRDYAFRGQESAGLLVLSFGYIISALIGIIVVTGLVFLIARFLNKKNNL